MASATNSLGKRKRPMSMEEWEAVADRLAEATAALRSAWDEVTEHYPLAVSESVRGVLRQLTKCRMKLMNQAYAEHGPAVESLLQGSRFLSV